MRVFKPSYKARNGKRKKAAKWYVGIQLGDKNRLRLPGFADRQATERLGHKVEDLISLRQRNAPLSAELAEWLEDLPNDIRDRLLAAGLIDRGAIAYTAPLAEHVEAYRGHLVAKRLTAEYVDKTISRTNAVVTGCGFDKLTDLDAARVNLWLHEQAERGMGLSTCNHYGTAVKGFAAWMVVSGRLSRNPFPPKSINRLDAKTDIRRKRRAIPLEELDQLIAATADGPDRCNLSGRDRAMLYLTAAYTGLRASELASLTPRSIDLAGETPIVTVEAAYSKHRREDTLPLHPELVARLREWIADRDGEPATTLRIDGVPADRKPLWPGRWAADRHAAEMLRSDLAAARQEWIEAATVPAERERREKTDVLAYRDHRGRVFDFHALRHQTGSMLA
ncbi:MAG: tyrosine-type recombinase/integrase, partial [Planctomycetota bacterium]|nr:tyrosine-type recombinase/integrase [Planctomycetota bacterium]